MTNILITSNGLRISVNIIKITYSLHKHISTFEDTEIVMNIQTKFYLSMLKLHTRYTNIFQRSSVYNGHLRWPVTHTPVAECFAVELPFFVLQLKIIHNFFSAPKKADLNPTPHCIAMNTGTWERGTLTTRVKRYVQGLKPCIQAFTSIGKLNNESCKIMWRQAHRCVIYW